MIKRYQIKNKIFIIIIVILLIIGIYSVSIKLYKNYTYVDINGAITSTSDDILYNQLVIKVNSQEFEVKDNGEFFINDIPRNSTIIISGDILYQDIIVKTDGDKDLEIFIDTSMEQFLAKVEQMYQYRKFRTIYGLLGEEYTKATTEDIFISSENAYFDKLLYLGTDHPCTITNVHFEDRMYLNDIQKVDLDLIIYLNEECIVNKISRKVNIELVNDIWRLNI